MKKPFINKKYFKRKHKICCICKEGNYTLLDVHRWRIEGSEGGKYSNDNTLCVCSNCHRLIHNDEVEIIGVFNSTKGRLVNFIDKNGEEQFNLF